MASEHATDLAAAIYRQASGPRSPNELDPATLLALLGLLLQLARCWIDDRHAGDLHGAAEELSKRMGRRRGRLVQVMLMHHARQQGRWCWEQMGGPVQLTAAIMTQVRRSIEAETLTQDLATLLRAATPSEEAEL